MQKEGGRASVWTVHAAVPKVVQQAEAVAALVWLAVVGLAAGGLFESSLTEALLLLGVLVLVPAAAALHPGLPRLAVPVGVLAAAPVGVALSLPQGWLASALSLPWLLAATAGAVAALANWWRTSRRVAGIVWPAASAYLVVGAAWLAFDRAGIEPGGFGPPLVQLTAVHFHYAGFVAPVLAACAFAWLGGRSRTAAVALTGTVIGPPLVASGFAYLPALQAVGAAVLTVGLLCLAWVTVRHVVPAVDRLTGTLLLLSSVAVAGAMLLGLQWALGSAYGLPALSIPAMVWTHGLVNAFGFGLLGVIGWRRALHRRAA